ncbi:MAG: fused MFS/spermidine synthase, partial [Opitutaceae bacterium]|nr:fused MFS/spermidine synthase [Verrucomicrobiales bacterium]
MIRALVPFLFFCSGATALVYEVIWSRYLGLMFGSTIQAQTIVLAVFMGGLALGNRVFGKRSDLFHQPLAAYGYVEILIGLYAFFFHNFFGLADRLFVKAGAGLLDHGTALLVLKSFLAVGLLLAPTLLMGGTLPLLATWLQRSGSEAGRLSAAFYAINSLGAVAGSFLGGFVLVRELGLLSAVQATALLNVLIGVTAIGISRRQGDSRAQETQAVRDDPADLKTSALRRRRIMIGGVLVAMTGGVSMGLEVVSSRLLALVFGGSLQAFAIMLMAFILGIGLGSALIATRRAQRWQKSGTTAWLLILAAVYIGFFIFNMERVTVAYVKARGGLAPTAMGFYYHQILVGGISMIVLGIPAALVGATVPLWIQVLSDSGAALGNRVGRLLTWNTLGAVVGVILTGFVLMPVLGLRGSLGLLASLLAGIGVAVAWTEGQKKLAAAGVGVIAMLLAVMALGGESWRQVFSYGVFRYRHGDQIEDSLKRRREYISIPFYEDAADATVSVETSTRPAETNQFVLRINGKPDASTKGDLSTQYLVAHLPLLALPDAKDVFMLGFGSGITGGAALGHPIEQLVLAENCSPVLRAGKWFEPWNRGVLTDRRTRLRIEDARTVLKLSPQLYDVVICEPSNPWVAGVGNVFS